MFYTIYKITNKINGKAYIGKHQTRSLDDTYMGSGKYLKHAIKKYGIENFTKEILFIFETEEEMNFMEKQIVTLDFCNSTETYNICEGGQGGFSYINNSGIRNGFEKTRNNPDVLEKIMIGSIKGSESFKKKLKECPEFKAKHTENYTKNFVSDGSVWSGRKHSKESIEKMSKPKNVGSTNSQYGTMWITNGEVNTKVKKESQIPDGWKKGRVTKK